MILNKYSTKKEEFKIDRVHFVKIVFTHDYQKSKNLILFVHHLKLNQNQEIAINERINLINKEIYPKTFIVYQEFIPPKGNLGENLFEIPKVLNNFIQISAFKEDEIQILALLSLFLLKFEKIYFTLEDIEKVKNCSQKEFSNKEVLKILTECPLILNTNEKYSFVDYNFVHYFSAKEFNNFESTNYLGEYPKIQSFSQINKNLLTKQKKPFDFEKRFSEFQKIQGEIEKLILDQDYENAANLRDDSIRFFNKNIIRYWTEMNLNNWKKNEL